MFANINMFHIPEDLETSALPLWEPYRLQDEWSHIYVGITVWTNTIMCAMFLLQFTCIIFAKILCEIPQWKWVK